MSSNSTNPYKSRLLNLINRQSIRLKEQFSRTGRHLKVAVEMGVQILIYPLYLLVQTGRMTGRQLKQNIEKKQFILSESSTQSQSELMTCNQPIEQILTTLDPWFSESKDSISPSAVSPALEKASISVSTYSPNKNLVIQGIASLIKNQKLVLVSSENFIIDIFSTPQQQQLKESIYWEIAKYQYQRRLQLRAAKKFPSLIPSFQINSPNVLPPVRWFWTVMRWIQTSEVAQAINLFEESTLIHNRPNLANIASFEQETGGIIPITNPVVIKEKNNVLPSIEGLNNYSINLGRLQVIIQAAIEYFFGPGKAAQFENSDSSLLSSTTETDLPNLAGQEVATFANTDTKTPLTLKKQGEKVTPTSSTLKTPETDPFQIQVLIQAAIDYFFGQHQKQVSLGGNKTAARLSTPSNLSPISNEPVPDPWLSSDDLFTQNSPQENTKKPNNIIPSTSAQLTAAATPVKPRKTLIDQVKQVKQNITELNKKTIVAEKPLTNITPISPQTNSLKATPEWIETEATPVGYVKHPLVKVLEALDRLIFWLEGLWVRIWNWLKRNKNINK